jgi:hypothetical protein
MLELSIKTRGLAEGGFPPRLVEHAVQGGPLRAFLIAWHHGGSFEMAREDSGLRLRLRLPSAPESVQLPAPDQEWLAIQFSMLEKWD